MSTDLLQPTIDQLKAVGSKHGKSLIFRMNPNVSAILLLQNMTYETLITQKLNSKDSNAVEACSVIDEDIAKELKERLQFINFITLTCHEIKEDVASELLINNIVKALNYNPDYKINTYSYGIPLVFNENEYKTDIVLEKLTLQKDSIIEQGLLAARKESIEVVEDLDSLFPKGHAR